MKPVILVTASSDGTPEGVRRLRLAEAYAEKLSNAGALPAAYVCGDPKECAGRFSGLLLTGGGDIAPEYYGEQIMTDTLSADTVRDRRELALFSEFCKAGLPIFGICRGVQLINVGLGGTLWQDIETQTGKAHPSGTAHPVHTEKDSLMRSILGENAEVNSFHHQCVKAPGEGIRVTARCGDVIEAIEHISAPIFGVQWHPERTELNDGLFLHFVSLCKGERPKWKP